MSGPLDPLSLEEVLDRLLTEPPDRWEEVARSVCGEDEVLVETVLSVLRAAPAAESYLDGLAGRLGLTGTGSRSEGLVGQKVGAYRLVELLGRGGMGSVYLGERDEGDFQVKAAVKLVATGLVSSAARERFLSERRILSKLDHPNIARLFDGGFTEDLTPYFIMEYVDGKPIHTHCDDERLGVAKRVELFLEICAAVRHAHENLIIHRDLKPENVLVSNQGEVKLLDFGIARALDPSDGGFLTATAQPHPMTLAYASPEQVLGQPLTTASDVYALGVLLYHLLTGRHPYADGSLSLAQAQQSVVHTDPTAPARALEHENPNPGAGDATGTTGATATEIAARRGTTVPKLRRELSGDLGRIVLMALRKEPERRYRSVADLADDLRRYLEGRPVSARPDTLVYRFHRFVVRRRRAVAAAAAILVLASALVLLGVQYTLDTRAQSQRIATEAETTEEVFDFLVDILALADPGGGGGDTLTVRAALARGVQEQRERLADRPVLRARLLQQMADTYLGLGLEDEAVALLEEAVGLHPETGTLADTTRGDLLNQLGVALRRSGRAERSQEQHQNASDLLSRIGADSLRISGSLANLSFALQRLEQPDSALALHALALDLDRRLLGSDHPRTLATETSHATLLRAAGQMDSAVALLRDVVTRADAMAEPPEVMGRALNNLGLYLRMMGDDAGAAASYRRTLDEYGEGMSYPNRQILMNNLASAQWGTGDTLGAAATLRERLELARAWWPEGHWRVGSAATAYGMSLMDAGDTIAAEAYFREAAASYASSLGAEHPWTARAESELGSLLGLLGKADEAERLLLRGHGKIEADPGLDERWARESRERLVAFYTAQGRHEEAARYR